MDSTQNISLFVHVSMCVIENGKKLKVWVGEGK